MDTPSKSAMSGSKIVSESTFATSTHQDSGVSITPSHAPTKTINKSDNMTDDLIAVSDDFILDMMPSSSAVTSTTALSSMNGNVPSSFCTVSSSNTAAFRQSKLPPESIKDTACKLINKATSELTKIDSSKELELDDDSYSSESSAKQQVKKLIIRALSKFTLWDMLLNIIRLVVVIFMIRGVAIGSFHSNECPAASALPVAVILGCMTMLVYIFLGLIVEYADLPYNVNALGNVQSIFTALIVTNIFIATHYTMLNPPKVLIIDAKSDVWPEDSCDMSLFLVAHGYVYTAHSFACVAALLFIAMTYVDVASPKGWFKCCKIPDFCKCLKRRQ